MKNIKRFCLLLLILTISFALFMCSPEKEAQEATRIEKEDVFYWNLNLMPRLFFPSMTLNETEKEVVNHLYEGLTRVSDGQLKMGMAKEFTVDKSRLVYTFTLKKVHWSDGWQVQPKDFIYAWERSDNYVDGVNLLYLEASIESVRVVGNDQLVIQLRQENDELLKHLSQVGFMPIREEALDLDNPFSIQSGKITNGPYYLSYFNSDEGFILKKNRNYYESESVLIREIHGSLDDSFARVYSQLNQGNLHFAQNVDWYNMDYYVTNEPKLKVYKDRSEHVFAFNLKDPALSKVGIRKLLKAAVDIEAINPFFDTVSSSISENSFSGVSEASLESLIPLANSEDLEHLYGLTIVTRNNPNDIRAGNLLAENWRVFLGIECVVEPKDANAYHKAFTDGDYHVILTEFADNPKSTWTFLKNFWGNQPLNKVNYFNNAYNQLLLESYNDKDEKFLVDAEKILEASTIFFSVFPGYDVVFIQPTVKNWSRSDEGLFYFGRSSIIKVIKD